MKSLSKTQLHIMIMLWFLALAISGIAPKDRITWWLEIFPVLFASGVLIFSAKSFPLPRYILAWIFIHGIVLMIGGHYTYAEVPFGFWLQKILGFSRNPYDRIGHFMQGFVPALIAREILIRKVKIPNGGWLFFITVSICLAISATYEFLEWWSAVILGQGADAFLGTQGDPWDTQWDMFMAMVGAITALLLYSQKKENN